jgi:hypothetical protein
VKQGSCSTRTWGEPPANAGGLADSPSALARPNRLTAAGVFPYSAPVLNWFNSGIIAIRIQMQLKILF